MKSETLKSALSAHGWVGLIISLPLFIVFWAGAITLFHPEMQQWSQLPYYNIDTKAKAVGHTFNYNTLVKQQLKKYNPLPGERISLRLPTEKSPYLRLLFQAPIDSKENNTLSENSNSSNPDNNKKKVKKQLINLLVDPYTGKVITDDSKFKLADFIYRLHYNMHLPQGSYIVGIITLFFFAIIITGVIVQLKNLVKNFFMYRKDQTTRSQMNDIHNVIGVISLPYAVMYAVTGIMLNLLVFVQIPSVFLLYNGDLDAISTDAGFYTFKEELSGEPQSMPDLETITRTLEKQHNAKVNRLNIFNYGDKSAVIEVAGQYNEGFSQDFRRFYHVSTNSYPDKMNLPEDNVFSSGLRILYSMHFADYAGTDMRILYFILAIAFCGMIVAGNVLWIIKRQQTNKYSKTLAFTRGVTLGGCLGVITATAFAMLLERILPENILNREHLIEYTFGIILLVISVSGFLVIKIKSFIGYNFIVSASFILLTLVYEWLILGKVIIILGSAGYTAIWYFSIGLFITAILLFWVGTKVLRYKTAIEPIIQLPS